MSEDIRTEPEISKDPQRAVRLSAVETVAVLGQQVGDRLPVSPYRLHRRLVPFELDQPEAMFRQRPLASTQYVNLEALHIHLHSGDDTVSYDRVDRQHRCHGSAVRIEAVHAVQAAGEPGGAGARACGSTNRLDGVPIKSNVLLKQIERVVGWFESYHFCAQLCGPYGVTAD